MSATGGRRINAGRTCSDYETQITIDVYYVDPQGRSLVARQQLTLLWRQGESLWLLRQPLGGGEGAGAARAGLTNS